MDVEKLIKRIKCPQIQSCPMDGEYPSCKACQKSIQQEVITTLSTLQAENEKLRAELERTKAEQDAAINTIFQWTGCPECKYWNSADEWCEKHDRYADSCGGCDSPEWRGPQKEDV